MGQISIYARDGVNAIETGRSRSRSARVDAACLRYNALVREAAPEVAADRLRALVRLMPSGRPWSPDEIRGLPAILRDAADVPAASVKARRTLRDLADLTDSLTLQGRIALVDLAERGSR